MSTFKNLDSDVKTEYHRVYIRFNFVENTCDQRMEYKKDHIELVPVENSGSISLVGTEKGSSEINDLLSLSRVLYLQSRFFEKQRRIEGPQQPSRKNRIYNIINNYCNF